MWDMSIKKEKNVIEQIHTCNTECSYKLDGEVVTYILL